MISQALDRCLRWHLTYPCSRCPLRYLERERTEGRKREKFYICLDVTHTHTPHTHNASNPRENYRNATSISPCTTRATQGDHRWHQVPCLPRKNTPRVTTEGTRHIRGNASASYPREISVSQPRGFAWLVVDLPL